MGLFSFFFGSPLGIITGLITTLVMLVIVLVVVTGALAFTGGPGACTPGGGAIEISDAHAQSFDQKWDQLDAALDGGQSTSITLSESEVSSRADRYLDDKGGDVSDIRVCIHSGFGEVTGKVDASVSKAKFRVKGTVDLSGDHPDANFDDVEVGNVPGAVIGPFENLVEDAIQEVLDDINLKHTYSVTLAEGSATIEGAPQGP
jgi:hypothetical protein